MKSVSVALNLVVIYSHNLSKSIGFYEKLGLTFEREQHGNGPLHYSCNLGTVVLEIYPVLNNTLTTKLRLGFSLPDIEKSIEDIKTLGHFVITEPTNSEWGKRAVIEDPDGYKVELIENIKQ